jgi:chemotaxis protein CheD
MIGTDLFLISMADLAVVRNQAVTLCTPPLGACLAVAIFDPVAKVAGVLNSMLPEASIDPVRARNRPGMFLDSGISALLEQAMKLEAQPERLVICVAGGARILDETSYFNIGNRNFEVLEKCLKERGLRLAAAEVGGLSNRALQMNATTGEVRLKISGQASTKVLCKP